MRRQPSNAMESGRDHIPSLPWLRLMLAAFVAVGCDGDVQPAAKRPGTKALDQNGITVSDFEQQPSRPRTPAKQSGTIIGQRTTDIRKASVEVKNGNANVIQPKITAKDPITLSGNAYVSMIGKMSVLKIQHAMDLYHANNDRYPKDYDEFMTEIIKANNIALPVLPSRQKYAYDEKEHKLVILEYPETTEEPAPR